MWIIPWKWFCLAESSNASHIGWQRPAVSNQTAALHFSATSRLQKRVRNGQSELLRFSDPECEMSRVKRLRPRTDKPALGFERQQSGETATEELIHGIFCLIGSVTMLPVSQTQRRERLYTPLWRLDRAGWRRNTSMACPSGAFKKIKK